MTHPEETTVKNDLPVEQRRAIVVEAARRGARAFNLGDVGLTEAMEVAATAAQAQTLMALAPPPDSESGTLREAVDELRKILDPPTTEE